MKIYLVYSMNWQLVEEDDVSICENKLHNRFFLCCDSKATQAKCLCTFRTNIHEYFSLIMVRTFRIFCSTCDSTRMCGILREKKGFRLGFEEIERRLEEIFCREKSGQQHNLLSWTRRHGNLFILQSC